MSGGATRIVDGDGQIAGVRSNPLEVDFPDTRILLQSILSELRAMNKYLAELTGTYFDTEE
jgi:hypothetical protein